jgi:outer membrane lipoprotein SlyB
MRTYILGLPAAEVVHLLRAETEAAHGAPELDIGTPEKEYVIEEDFDRSAYGLRDGEDFDLATSIATLTIEPRVESGYWILETVIERPLGPVRSSQEDKMVREELTLDAFEAELRALGQKRVTVRLQVQTAAVRQDFDRWLADMRVRHPWKPEAAPSLAHMEHALEEGQMSNEPENRGTVKEAVGVFRDSNALEAAVDELEVSGFDRAAVSVLATDAKATEQVERFYRTVKEIEDSGRAPSSAFVSRDSRTEGEAAAVAVPLYVGGFAGAAAVAATGGALAMAIAAAIAGGVAGAGLGAILAAAIASHHAAGVRKQLDRGGFVLWVNVPNPDAEQRAVAILNKMGAGDVHVHQVRHEWGDIPSTVVQADPFLLEGDPS